MKLELHNILNNHKEWEDKGYILPKFDVNQVRENTFSSPEWLHFGGGNIFRAYIANISQTLLDKNIMDTGLITCSGFDYEIVEKIYDRYDNLSILATLNSNGNIEKKVIGSVTEALLMDRNVPDDFDRLKEIFESDSLKMVSFTITEKGYSIYDSNKELLDSVKEDLINGPNNTVSYMGNITSLLFERYKKGKLKLAMCSMDNCSHNGDILKKSIMYIASTWNEKNLVEEEFIDYLDNPSYVSFPYSMIDKITPRPSEDIKNILINDGIENVELFVTKKNTYLAPFVNAEKPEYLVMEDSFPNGRPYLEEGGIYITDRDTVNKCEKMKVTTCLNPIHTSLAIYGCLLGYTKLSEEMKNPCLKNLAYELGYKEGLPVVTDPHILSPNAFLKEVLEERIPNPYLPDTPQRIAMDTSQKIPVRFGETLKSYIERGMDLNSLRCIPMVFAGWLRYLMGIDDDGNKFDVSPDPFYDMLYSHIRDISLGEKNREYVEGRIEPILRDKRIFQFDLYDIGLSNKVIDTYMEEISEVGKVKEVLNRNFGG